MIPPTTTRPPARLAAALLALALAGCLSVSRQAPADAAADTASGDTASGDTASGDTASDDTGPADVLADTTDVLADTTDVLTDTTDVLQDTTDVLPDTPDVLPDTTDVLLDTTDVLPDTTDVLPDTTDVLQDTTDVLPDTADVLQDTTDALTDTTDDAQDGADDAQDGADTGEPPCDPFVLGGCDDGNPCTYDQCDSALGCLHIADDAAPCDDGEPCSIGDYCLSGTCVAGGIADCDDGDPCTDDACAAATGQCLHVPGSGAACDDGDPCTVDDACAAGACAGLPVVCTSDDPCLPAACDPATGGCVTSPATGPPCDDGDPCTAGDACAEGLCQGAATACDDGDPCTVDVCDATTGACTHDPGSGTSCDDGDPCTAGDACAEGACLGTFVCGCAGDADCVASSPCSVGTCAAGTCVFADADGPCDDGDACTLGDACLEGTCVPGEPAVCDDDEPCTSDACNPAGGCEFVPADGPCDDGDACTAGDACANGVCAPGPAPGCDDGDPCTTDSCHPEAGCVWKAGALPCGADEPCAAAACEPVATSGKTCEALGWGPGFGSALVCAETDQLPGQEGCVSTLTYAAAVARCEASGARLCTWSELMTDEARQTGCTLDAQRVWSSTACGTNGALTTAGATSGLGQEPTKCTPKPGVAYVRCCADAAGAPEKAPCVKVLLSGPCDDGDPCTAGDACADGACVPGPPVDCSAGSGPCATSTCVGGVCKKEVFVGESCEHPDPCVIEATCTAGGQCVGQWNGQDADCGCNPAACGPAGGGACSEQAVAGGCQTFYQDGDGDGYGLATKAACACAAVGGYTAPLAGDCNDDEPAAWTGAAERCDGIDNDCDGATDEAFPSLGAPCDGVDADLCPNGVVTCRPDGLGTACAESGPVAVEACNGKDDDCDGQTDEGFTVDGAAVGQPCDAPGGDACSDDLVVCVTAAQAGCTAEQPTPEVCDGADNDCDGANDEENAQGCEVWFHDADDDGFGTTSKCLCKPAPPYDAAQGGDCDDGSAAVNPKQTQYFEGARADGTWDYNCDLVESPQWPTQGDAGVPCKVGWLDAVPGCGKEGSYLTTCPYLLVNVVSRTQRCR